MHHPKQILGKLNLSPKKSMGQNFLVSEKTMERVVGAARIQKDDTVLEIGPGVGALTKKLADKSKKVVALEKDRRLIPLLHKELQEKENTKIVQADILETAVSSYLPSKYKVVSNLPFNISKRVIRKLLESNNPPLSMTFLVQKEVAQSICAQPPRMDLLSLAVQYYAETEYIQTVPRNHFWPQPEVEAALVRIKTKKPGPEPSSGGLFFKTARAGFRHRRKQLAVNLAGEFGLDKKKIIKLLKEAGIEPKARAENLSVEKWKDLTKKIGEVVQHQ